jgi:hypothetical protein
MIDTGLEDITIERLAEITYAQGDEYRGDTESERGVKKHRFLPSGEFSRYFFDAVVCTPERGWEQFDTDQDFAHYGVWVNRSAMQVVTYAEGDVYFFQASGREAFAAEIADLCSFHKKQPPAYTAYGEDGTVTNFYDRRITPEEAMKNEG